MPLAGKRLRPSDRSIGLLFMVGSALFGLGSFPVVNRWDSRVDNLSFAAGAVFFTSAATLQLIQSLAPPRPGREPGGVGELANIRGVEQWACAIQWIGTLWFNLMTIDALAHDLTATAARRRIWFPDAFGSICFLVASYLALAAVSGSWRLRFRGPPDLEGRIAELNWWGSLAFAVSAVGGWVLESGKDLSYTVATVGTFAGAVCFLLGARLMLPHVQRRWETRVA